MPKSVAVRAAVSMLVAALALVAPAMAAPPSNVNVPAGDLATALDSLAKQSGVEFIYSAEQLKGLRTEGVAGELTPEQAVKQLLRGTKLKVTAHPSGALLISDLAGGSNPGTDATLGDVEEVIITGSRLKRVDAVSANPVLVLSREQIERTGASTLTDVVRNALPIQSGSVTDVSNFGNVGTGQSNVNLRGLGNGSTLTLINGRRFALSGNSRINGGNVYNINSIPMGAVERIEVLKDGASAIYGSDAVAGVVNIILRKDYQGTEARVSYNNTFDTDSAVTSAAITTGVRGERGNGMFTIEAYRQNGMMARDRKFSASADQRSRGGQDVRVAPGLRGTVYAMPGQVLPGVFLPDGQPASFAAIPANQNGVGLTSASFNATAGVRDFMDQNDFMSTVPERDTVNMMGVFDYRLFDQVTLFGQVAYSHTDSFAYIYNNGQVSRGQLVLPVDNPYNPFGVPVMVEKNLVSEFGAGKRSNDYDDYGVVLGLRGALPGGWEWESAFNYGKSSTANGFDPYNVNAGQANAALTDPTLAYNWFADPAVVASGGVEAAGLIGYNLGRGAGELSMVDASVRGELFRLYGNPVQAVLGAEYRRDRYQQSYVDNVSPPGGVFSGGVIEQRTRTTRSLFSEIDVPLIVPGQAVPLVHALELSLAGRYEDLGPYGTTLDPRVGIRWQPFGSLTLRASFGTSFRAPTATEVGGLSMSFRRLAADPLRGGELADFVTHENSDLSLRPETSDNFSGGLVWEPAGARGLSVTLDYYRIRYQDKFSYLLPEYALRYESEFDRYITRAAPSAEDIARGWAGQITSMSLGYVNLAITTVAGVDFGVNYTWDTRLGKFNYSLVGTRTLEFDESAAPGVAAEDKLGEYMYPKRWQGNSSLFLSRGKVDAGVTFRYVGSYSVSGYGVFNPPKHIGAIKEFDVQGSYSAPWGMRVTAGINNVFNRDPPLFYAPFFYLGNFGYDNTLTSPRKATYYLSISQSF